MRLILTLLLALPFAAQARQADGSREQKEFTSELHRLRSQFLEATEEYKESLKQLLTLYEQEVTRSRERAKKSQELYEANLIGVRTRDEDWAAVPVAEAKVARVKQQIAEADEQISAVLKETADAVELEKKLLRQPAKRERGPRGRVYFVRFIVIGEIVIYDYSGAVRGRVIKRGNQVRYDSRKK